MKIITLMLMMGLALADTLKPPVVDEIDILRLNNAVLEMQKTQLQYKDMSQQLKQLEGLFGQQSQAYQSLQQAVYKRAGVEIKDFELKQEGEVWRFVKVEKKAATEKK